MDHQKKIEGYILALEKQKTKGEIEAFEQHLLRERFEYEEALLIIKKYENSDTAGWIEACKKILKENSHG